MNPYKKVAFYTLGCKLNFSETSSIARMFEKEGYAKVDFNDHPDVYIINTCSVTDNADKKCRYIVNKARKNNPDSFIAIIGCYAQLKPDEIAGIPGVDMVLGASEKFRILDHIRKNERKEMEETATVATSPIKEVRDFIPSFSYGDRTRTFLKVQDGCDYFCSFCTIPLARGRSRSNTIEETVRTARKVAESEVKEIVLTGVNIGDFGKGRDENFFMLIRELDKIEGIDRFRISSIEPNLLSNEIIEFVNQSEKFVPHFHIPLQSGSDKLLDSMRRRYKSGLYENRVKTIKSLMPDCCIGVDVIVGYPGETEEEFLTTYNFLKELDVSYFHVFSYSERPNTTAIRMGNQVPQQTKAERSKMLRILSEKKKRKFYEEQVGTEREVLIEGKQHNQQIHGFSENYVKVSLPYASKLENTICKVKLNEINPDGTMQAEIIEEMVPA